MKKSYLALLLPLLVGASSANAMELYNDNKNSLGLTGWLGFNALYDGDETAVNDNLSQLRFTFEREERNGWRAYAVTEWGVNIVSGNEDLVMQGGKLSAEKSGDFLNNRLGYVGLSHDKYGSLTFGK